MNAGAGLSVGKNKAREDKNTSFGSSPAGFDPVKDAFVMPYANQPAVTITGESALHFALGQRPF